MHDKRLIGTWKSDKRRTFRDFVFRSGVTEAQRKKVKSIFGKLTIRYTRTRVYCVSNGLEMSGRYRVLAKDKHSVAIWSNDFRCDDEAILTNIRLFPELDWTGRHILHIRFEGDHYWITVDAIPSIREYFRRTAPSRKTRQSR